MADMTDQYPSNPSHGDPYGSGNEDATHVMPAVQDSAGPAPSGPWGQPGSDDAQPTAQMPAVPGDQSAPYGAQPPAADQPQTSPYGSAFSGQHQQSAASQPSAYDQSATQGQHAGYAQQGQYGQQDQYAQGQYGQGQYGQQGQYKQSAYAPGGTGHGQQSTQNPYGSATGDWGGQSSAPQQSAPDQQHSGPVAQQSGPVAQPSAPAAQQSGPVAQQSAGGFFGTDQSSAFGDQAGESSVTPLGDPQPSPRGVGYTAQVPPPTPRNAAGDSNPITSLLDFSFNRYATPGLVKIVYILAIVVAVLLWIGGGIGTIVTGTGMNELSDGLGTPMVVLGVLQLVLGWIPAVLVIALTRIMLEFSAATVRTSTAVREIADRLDQQG